MDYLMLIYIGIGLIVFYKLFPFILILTGFFIGTIAGLVVLFLAWLVDCFIALKAKFKGKG